MHPKTDKGNLSFFYLFNELLTDITEIIIPNTMQFLRLIHKHNLHFSISNTFAKYSHSYLRIGANIHPFVNPNTNYITSVHFCPPKQRTIAVRWSL